MSSAVRRTSTSSHLTPSSTAPRNESSVFSVYPSTIPRPQPRWPMITGPCDSNTRLLSIKRRHSAAHYQLGDRCDEPAHLRVRALQIAWVVHLEHEEARSIDGLHPHSVFGDSDLDASLEVVLLAASLELRDQRRLIP